MDHSSDSNEFDLSRFGSELYQFGSKYLKLILREFMKLANSITVDSKPDQVIDLITESLIPRLQTLIKGSMTDVEKNKSVLSKTYFKQFADLKLVWSKDNIYTKVLEILTDLYNALKTDAVRKMILSNLKYMIDALFDYICYVYYYTYINYVVPKHFTANTQSMFFDDVINSTLMTGQMSYLEVLKSTIKDPQTLN